MSSETHLDRKCSHNLGNMLEVIFITQQTEYLFIQMVEERDVLEDSGGKKPFTTAGSAFLTDSL